MRRRAAVFDSSSWIEVFTRGPAARQCEKELESAAPLIVPTVVLFEVYKKLRASLSEDRALSAVAMMSQYEVQELTSEVALEAADLSLEHKLEMADSIVLAHARRSDAVLLTLDNDFSRISDAKVLRA